MSYLSRKIFRFFTDLLASSHVTKLGQYLSGTTAALCALLLSKICSKNSKNSFAQGMARKFRKTSAFSLIELLVVITIIGLLSTFVIPSISTVRTKSLAINCGNNLRLIQAAKEAYYSDNPIGDLGRGNEAKEHLKLYLGDDIEFSCPDKQYGSADYAFGDRNVVCSCPNKTKDEPKNGYHDLAPIR